MLAVDARDKNKDSLTQSRYEFKEKEARPRIYLVTEGLKSQATRDTYRIAFQIFLNDTVKNQDLSTLLDLKLTVIESKIISHIEYLRNVKKVKHSTIQTYISAIFHFFLMNDVALNIRKINRFYSEEDDEVNGVRDRPYSIDEISKILDKADVRSKVIILLLASTGMRLGAIPGLKIGDLKQISEFGLYMIWIYNNSKKHRYYSFCTPECAAAIDEYLDYRRRFGEVIKDSSPLIRESSLNNPFTIQRPRHITNRAISLIVEDLLKESGVNPLNQSRLRSARRTHGFRKHVITCMSKANLNFSIRESLSGHKLFNQDSHYVLFTEEEMLQEYMKVVPLLAVNSNSRLQIKINILESEKTKGLNDIHEKWISELKTQYSLIPVYEWKTIKSEMKYFKDSVIPMVFKLTGQSVHLDGKYTDESDI